MLNFLVAYTQLYKALCRWRSVGRSVHPSVHLSIHPLVTTFFQTVDLVKKSLVIILDSSLEMPPPLPPPPLPPPPMFLKDKRTFPFNSSARCPSREAVVGSSNIGIVVEEEAELERESSPGAFRQIFSAFSSAPFRDARILPTPIFRGSEDAIDELFELN